MWGLCRRVIKYPMNGGVLLVPLKKKNVTKGTNSKKKKKKRSYATGFVDMGIWGSPDCHIAMRMFPALSLSLSKAASNDLILAS